MAKSDEQIERESERKQRNEARKPSFGSKARMGQIADWASVQGAVVVRAVAAVGKVGGALRLGYTRDGGAYAIGIYVGDERETVYVSPGDSVEDVLSEIEAYYGKS